MDSELYDAQLHGMLELDVDIVERTTPEQAELYSTFPYSTVYYFLAADNSELNTGVQSVLSPAVYITNLLKTTCCMSDSKSSFCPNSTPCLIVEIASVPHFASTESDSEHKIRNDLSG